MTVAEAPVSGPMLVAADSGGLVSVEYPRLWRRIVFWILMLWLRTPGVSENMYVVVHDRTGKEVYRGGPYSPTIVMEERDRCAHRIDVLGLDSFLRASR